MKELKHIVLKWVKEQSKFKLAMLALIAVFVPYLLFIKPSGYEYRQMVSEEILLARKVCMAARNKVYTTPPPEKQNGYELRDVAVDGVVPEFKYIENPKVLFMHVGFATVNTVKSSYCIVKDPRGVNEYGSDTYYYDYLSGQWDGKIIVHNKKMGR